MTSKKKKMAFFYSLQASTSQIRFRPAAEQHWFTLLLSFETWNGVRGGGGLSVCGEGPRVRTDNQSSRPRLRALSWPGLLAYAVLLISIIKHLRVRFMVRGQPKKKKTKTDV